MGFIGSFAFMGIFYGIAEYEHLTGWKWALASVAVSATVKTLFPGSFIFVLPAQACLFGVLAWANIQRKKKFEVEQVDRKEQDRLMRQERAKVAHVKAEQEAAKPDPARAAREAKETEEVRLRQERVRRVREERERAEHEAREKEGGAQ
jgi:flagellar biosynthesis component FlhA